MSVNATQPQTWTYPDGTKSVHEPSDGQVFMVWDSNQNVTEVWQWDGFNQKWYDVTSHKVGSIGYQHGKTQLGVQPSSHDPDFDLLQEFERLVAENDVKCECGNKEAPVGQRHSTWCDLYKREF